VSVPLGELPRRLCEQAIDVVTYVLSLRSEHEIHLTNKYLPEKLV